MGLFSQIDFKGLKPYLEDPDVTDINCRNQKEVWITSNGLGHHQINIEITPEDIQSIATQVAHRMEKEFNPSHPCLEGDIQDETMDLRVSAIHPYLAVHGTSLALRKVSRNQLLSEDYLIESQYIQKDALRLLHQMVTKGLNILIIGETGSGKTELLKYLACYIPQAELIATIEDSLEFNIQQLHQGASCSAFRVKKGFDYSSVIAMSLRQNVNWILLQEARGEEVNDLLEAMSTGHKVMTTMHAKSATQVAIRVKQMLHRQKESLESIQLRVHSLIDIVICLKKVQTPKLVRYVESITSYDYDEDAHKGLSFELYHHQKGLQQLPDSLVKRLEL